MQLPRDARPLIGRRRLRRLVAGELGLDRAFRLLGPRLATSTHQEPTTPRRDVYQRESDAPNKVGAVPEYPASVAVAGVEAWRYLWASSASTRSLVVRPGSRSCCFQGHGSRGTLPTSQTLRPSTPGPEVTKLPSEAQPTGALTVYPGWTPAPRTLPKRQHHIQHHRVIGLGYHRPRFGTVSGRYSDVL